VSRGTKTRRSRRNTQAKRLSELAAALAGIGRSIYSRGWALGTSGNFSAVATCAPFRLMITPTGVDKGRLEAGQLVLVDGEGKLAGGAGRPSVETVLHLAIVRARGAGAVLHTHSIWSTILSDEFAGAGGLWIEGYEMLKGLEGIHTHRHREWLPIVENSQDMTALAASIEETLKLNPDAHGFLLRRHGLYTWGSDLAQAKGHLEILEFLLEVIGRTRSSPEARGG